MTKVQFLLFPHIQIQSTCIIKYHKQHNQVAKNYYTYSNRNSENQENQNFNFQSRKGKNVKEKKAKPKCT